MATSEVISIRIPTDLLEQIKKLVEKTPRAKVSGTILDILYAHFATKYDNVNKDDTQAYIVVDKPEVTDDDNVNTVDNALQELTTKYDNVINQIEQLWTKYDTVDNALQELTTKYDDVNKKPVVTENDNVNTGTANTTIEGKENSLSTLPPYPPTIEEISTNGDDTQAGVTDGEPTGEDPITEGSDENEDEDELEQVTQPVEQQQPEPEPHQYQDIAPIVEPEEEEQPDLDQDAKTEVEGQQQLFPIPGDEGDDDDDWEDNIPTSESVEISASEIARRLKELDLRRDNLSKLAGSGKLPEKLQGTGFLHRYQYRKVNGQTKWFDRMPHMPKDWLPQKDENT